MLTDEINKLISSILENLSCVNEEEAETIADSVNMIKDELLKPEPKRTILSNGIKLLSPMIAIANGVPELASNIQSFITFVSTFI